jgi:hypothetical protein
MADVEERRTVLLHFYAWFELPYTIEVNWHEEFSAEFQPGLTINLDIRFRNDLRRVDTRNPWSTPVAWSQRPEDEETGGPRKIVPRYVTMSDVPGLEKLVKEFGLPYLHLEWIETVVETHGLLELPEDVMEVIDEPGGPSEVNPEGTFFNDVILPRVARAVDAYRIATLPAARYAAYPVSEAMVEMVYVEIRDSEGRIRQNWGQGIDRWGHRRGIKTVQVQERFDAIMQGLDDLATESLFSSCYYLFHMRRWAEAMTIASAAIDKLLKEVVFAKLDKRMAEVVWGVYRTRYDDVFKLVFPALNLPKLSDVNKGLWERFTQAKKGRGSGAHGALLRDYDQAEQKAVFGHLTAFYETARWICDAIGKPWHLDVMDKGTPLPPM